MNDKYCKWKDKLELLPRHVVVCEFQDKNLKDWLQGFDRFTEKPKETSNGLLFYSENEHLQERINNEVPKAPLLARLYAKDSSSKALFVDAYATNKTNRNEGLKAASRDFEFLEGFLNETEEDGETAKDLNKTLSQELDIKVIIGKDSTEKQGEDTVVNVCHDSEEEEKKKGNDENVNPMNDPKEIIGLDLTRTEQEMSKKRKLKEPALCLKLKQMKS